MNIKQTYVIKIRCQKIFWITIYNLWNLCKMEEEEATSGMQCGKLGVATEKALDPVVNTLSILQVGVIGYSYLQRSQGGLYWIQSFFCGYS